MSIEDELHTLGTLCYAKQKLINITTIYVKSIYGVASLLKFGFPLLISLKNALPHSTIACNVSYFQYLKGCKTVL